MYPRELKPLNLFPVDVKQALTFLSVKRSQSCWKFMGSTSQYNGYADKQSFSNLNTEVIDYFISDKKIKLSGNIWHGICLWLRWNWGNETRNDSEVEV